MSPSIIMKHTFNSLRWLVSAINQLVGGLVRCCSLLSINKLPLKFARLSCTSFIVTLCLLVSLSSISLLITIVIFHDAPAFVVKLDLLYIQNLHLSILSSVGRVIVCFFVYTATERKLRFLCFWPIAVGYER
uniref:Uncharacterized protein n=1 Tax=Enterobacter cloacae TaxID=550 RepID=A0A076U840_ENTCL|nr:hypothetical protein [Enterobacter cloacae]